MSLNSIRQLQQWRQQNIDQSEVDILIAHVLKKRKEFLIAYPEYRIGRLKNWKIKKLIAKRIKGIPVAHLTGHKEFFGLDFMVNKYTLIPRPETELMVEKTKEELKEKTILIDIGTGSGCIPISILKSYNLQSSIFAYATDISKRALKIARKNAQKYGTNITFLHGNLLEPVLKKYELLAIGYELIITANLPYLTQEQFETESSIQHEPHSALVAEDEGLELYKKLLNQIKQLHTTYSLALTTFFEIDPSQAEQLSSYIKTIFPHAKIEIFRDGMKNERIIKSSFRIDKI